MSFEAIEQEIVGWDAAKLRKLQALIVSLRLRRDDPDFPDKIADRIDDHAPERWLTEEEFARKLGLSEDE